MAGEISKIKTSDGVEHALEVDLSNYYTKSEDDALLGAKADSSAVYTKSESDLLLANKADKTDIYTKAQLDLLFDSKANVNTVYTKGETDNLLSDKADVATTYTKSETDTLLLGKADANDVYPKSQTYNRTQADDLLATKADNDSVYSKSDIDTALGLKADSADVYTKTETDVLLGAKADSADVYTITQTDTLLDGKASIDDTATTSTVVTWSADKLHTEFQNVPKLDSVNTFEVYQIISSSGIDTTDAPSQTTWGDGISFGDKNNVRTAFIAPSQNTDGSVDICTNTENGRVLINDADTVNYTTDEQLVGYLDNGSTKTPIYRKTYIGDNVNYSGTFVIDSNLKSTNVIMFNCGGAIKIDSPSNEWLSIGGFNGSQSTSVYSIQPQLVSSGFNLMYSWSSFHCTNYKIWIEYIKIS